MLGIVAILLAPALFDDHFVVLVLLRPTKEVLLAGGFFLRQDDVEAGGRSLTARTHLHRCGRGTKTASGRSSFSIVNRDEPSKVSPSRASRRGPSTDRTRSSRVANAS